jgi:hypothetical protein
MLIAGIAVVCVVLLVLGFLLPRLSRYPQRGVDKGLGESQLAGAKAPGPLGRWLQKPFRSARKAADESASAGRRGRSKLPL